LSALDGLAAAAAHQLGTPLSTIALAAKEMLSEMPPGPLREDVELILSQSARCREILARLRNLGADGGDPFATVPISDLLAEVARPHEEQGKEISLTRSSSGGPEPVIHRSVSLLYGLGNLIENAVSFAARRVTIHAEWDKAHLTVTVADDGPGFPDELITRLGEPYLTTRERVSEGKEGGGLGLGIFIAKTLLERSGARLSFENATEHGHARVRVSWPRRAIEADFGRP
ncbi:MAG TPA: HAMP domain-containing histidine kinase, partial [Alphaproteobacteria bacterium]|nr:HAMP domain-containing histidine kinase [Alphaproteobacteria bacterium]